MSNHMSTQQRSGSVFQYKDYYQIIVWSLGVGMVTSVNTMGRLLDYNETLTDPGD